jgi:hypothetical protein
MEGPLLVLKSWALTALAIWVYRRWFQRVAPPTPQFEAFCAEAPVIAALYGLDDTSAAAAGLRRRLGKASASIATLGVFPWPHYRLVLAVEQHASAILLRVTAAEVVRTKHRDVPALATILRDVLNELPEGAHAWMHAGTFGNGLDEPPLGGWALQRGAEKRPRFEALALAPEVTRLSLLGLGEPDALLLALRNRVDHAVPGIAR